MKRVISRLPDDTMDKLRYCVGKFAVKKLYGPYGRMLTQEQAVAVAIEVLHDYLLSDVIDDQRLKAITFDVVEQFNIDMPKKQRGVKAVNVKVPD